MKKTLAAFAVLAAGMFSASAHAAPILIDDFRDANHFPLPQSQQGWAIPLFTQSNPFVMVHSNAVDPVGTILGSQRDVLINVTTTPKGVSANGVIGDVDEEDPGIEGVFEFGSSATAMVTATLEYDGVDPAAQVGSLTNALALGGTNFVSTGNNAFALAFGSVDAAPGELGMSIRIEVTSAVGTAIFDGMVPEASGDFIYQAPFASFSNQGALSAATSIRFIFNDGGSPDPAVDFSLRSISAVPEPATIVTACMGIVFVGATAWRHRRKQAAA